MEWRGVLDDGGGRSSAGQEALIRSAISGWRDSLVDLTAASPLLNLGPGRAGVIEVARPSAGDILARLAAGGTFTFRSLKPWPAPPAPGPGGEGPARPSGTGEDGTPGALPAPAPYILDTGMDPDDLDATLRALMRHANQQYTDRGVPVLHLALGTLTWAGRDRARHHSPLLLVPARLVATEPRQPPMLEPAEHDPVVNPALRLKLAEHAIALPRLDDPADIVLSGLLDAVRAAVAGQGDWLVSESAALTWFPPMKEAVYQDLLDHEDLVATHPAVRALAGHRAAGTRTALDELAGHGAGPAPATEAPRVVLAADSAQRACIKAALAGRSFTLDGPPGTGKSQTIANMTGALLHAGRTVLVVSEKAAALEVVATRLAGAGLGGYLLELHSDKATRKEVAASLGAALAAGPAKEGPPAAAAPAGGRRKQLSAYADALHRVREPLGCSLHDVLQMIASLPAVPAAPAAGVAPGQLTAEVLREVRRAAADLAHAWRPAVQGESFPWRGVTEPGSLDERLYEAASALEALAAAVRANQTLADATGLRRPSDAPELARLLDHLMAWPDGMPDEWLTLDTLDAVDAAVAHLAAVLTAIAARETQATAAAGIPWADIPQPGALPQVDTRALAALVPACIDLGPLASRQLGEVAREFGAVAGRLEKRLGTLSGLAGMLGLRSPATFTDANDLLTLVRLAGEPDRPERAWLTVPGHQAASNAARVLYEAHRALATAEAEAGRYFTADALRYDTSALVQRFANNYQGLGRLSGDYRADKKTVAAFTREGVTAEAAAEHLELAAAWKHAAESLAAAERSQAALLGPHYAGRATDFARLGRALTHAAVAVRCARGQDLTRAADYISRDTVPNQGVAGIAAQTRQDLSAWQALLAPSPAIAPRPELLDGTITAAIEWLRAHVGPLRAASGFTHAVGDAVGRSFTFGQARQLVALREAADSARTELAARDGVFHDLCGQLYAGTATDVMTLREALEWARELRSMITGGPGPLTPAHLDAAESAVPTDRLAKAADAWQESCAALLAAFSPQRRPTLAAELDDYQAGDQLLESMFNDTGGRGEWHAHQAARAALAALGLDAAAEFCATERVEAAQVPQVIEQALLLGWASYQLRTDPALAPLRALGAAALSGGHRQLDRALAAAAAEDVIRACDARRPSSGVSESAVTFLAAAQQQHMPVAELMELARHVIQAVKPCFLATPQAVSQYLPGGMRFDTVIFDEASQIGPADAAGCAYRGNALILAGDCKQLPPTASGRLPGDGHGRPAGPGELPGPESVLDLAKASGAFGNLSLRWHYRSRHEALIAYSNAAFYAGRLTPLPGPRDALCPDAGVELCYSEGTHRSATARDTMAQPARVAQRVIHHCDTRPALSLGVVTFSEAEAEAIETALATARKERPDLDGFFTGDRLRGFFVKPVEAVQGDERDVVIVSLRGADEQGRFPAGLGTLGTPDGWRRLNVAITRARYRTEIVSGILPGGIPEHLTSEGLRHLRHYLTYAAQQRPSSG